MSDRSEFLSVIILTYNEEANLPACLESLKGLNCDIFVVDSGSTDRTVTIARAAGAQVAEHPFDNYAAQRNWAQQNLPLHTDWVLHLDADERLMPKLVREISQELGVRSQELEARSEGLGVKSKELGVRSKEKLVEIDGFLLRKRTIFMGRWIKHGGHYPSYHLRLFRKECGFCEDRLYDQHFVVNGNVKQLEHDYIDVLTSDISTWTLRHVHWAELEARELMTNHRSESCIRPDLLGNPIERKRWLRNSLYARLPLFVRPFLYWFYRYFVRLGFLDGKEGFIFHFLQAFWFRLLVDIKLEEMERERRVEGRDTAKDRELVSEKNFEV